MREVFLNSAFFGVFLCLFTHQIGLLIKRKFKFAILNPLLIAIILCILCLYLFDMPYEKFNASAEHISFFLTPATICLAVPLYEQLELLKHNYVAILIGLVSGVFFGLLSIFALSILLGLDYQMYVTMLPKSVTTPIGIGISHQLGGVVTITVSVILITGIFGSVIADSLFKIFKIKNKIAKGISLGCASHVMGTAKAIEYGDIEGAMASLSIAVSGLLTVVGASIFARFF